MRKLLLLRPEPGLSASAERARALGLDVMTCPLFRVEPVEWKPPEPAGFDGLLITSANAIRHGGPELQQFRHLPLHAVGRASAQTARDAGFAIGTVGNEDAERLLAALPAPLRLLHLSGADSRCPQDERIERRIVYRSVAIDQPKLPELEGLVAVVHSPRAGARLRELVQQRERTVVAAISAAAAGACGAGWERVEIAEAPSDNSLLALAAMLCHTSGPE